MKANFKMTLTAIAATVMCAVPMISMIANADTFEKSRNFNGISEPEMSIVTQLPEYWKPLDTYTKPLLTGTKPAPTLTRPTPTFTKPMPTLTRPTPTFTKPMPTFTRPMPVTWIDPLTDPIKEDFEIGDRYYMVSNIRTTTVEVAKNIR